MDWVVLFQVPEAETGEIKLIDPDFPGGRRPTRLPAVFMRCVGAVTRRPCACWGFQSGLA